MTPPADFAALRAVSARFGADPMLIQGPGGNTSLKAAGVMWIKASGALLAEAERQNIFVAVERAPLLRAVEREDPVADEPARFALAGEALRPSIETCVHAVFAQRVVLHVHCVNTVALALRQDARARIAERLAGFRFAYVDYVKPGARLAAKLRAEAAGADVVALGNHGLIVAANTVEAAAALTEAAAQALSAEPAPGGAADLARLNALADAGFAPAPEGHPLHAVALSPRLLALAVGGSLYPDHVVFCGAAATALAEGDDAARLSARLRARGLAPPPFLLAPGAGALIHEEASASQRALARCLGDVLARVPEGAAPRYLTDEETRELIDWDAEKYRQALNAR